MSADCRQRRLSRHWTNLLLAASSAQGHNFVRMLQPESDSLTGRTSVPTTPPRAQLTYLVTALPCPLYRHKLSSLLLAHRYCGAEGYITVSFILLSVHH